VRHLQVRAFAARAVASPHSSAAGWFPGHEDRRHAQTASSLDAGSAVALVLVDLSQFELSSARTPDTENLLCPSVPQSFSQIDSYGAAKHAGRWPSRLHRGRQDALKRQQELNLGERLRNRDTERSLCCTRHGLSPDVETRSSRSCPKRTPTPGQLADPLTGSSPCTDLNQYRPNPVRLSTARPAKERCDANDESGHFRGEGTHRPG
jgi:hypothetical protein